MPRLRRTYRRSATPEVPVADAAGLLNQQSLAHGLLAAVAVAIVLNLIWLWLSNVTDSYFHAYSLLQGPLIGLAVRRGGRGIDWRFPLLAACVTVLAAFSGNFLVSLVTTGEILDVSPAQVLRGLTVWSWQTWYAEVLSSVDLIYALFSGAVAAFYARRRLRRHEAFALRSMKREAQR